MPEFKPFNGEFRVGENEFIRPSRDRGELLHQQNSNNYLIVPRRKKLSWRYVVAIIGLLTALVAGASQIITAIIKSKSETNTQSVDRRSPPSPVPPILDLCTNANTHFSWAEKLGESNRNELLIKYQAMDDHRVKFIRCDFATAAAFTMTRLHEKLYAPDEQTAPPNGLAPPIVPTSDRSQPKLQKSRPAPLMRPAVIRGTLGIGEVINSNGFWSMPLNIMPGFTTCFIVRGGPIVVKSGRRNYGPFVDEQLVPIYNEDQDIYKIKSVNGFSLFEVVGLAKGKHEAEDMECDS